MKDYPYVPGWRLNKNSNKPRVKTSVLMLTKHGIAEGEWEGSDWVQYRWSCIVKDSDVLYWMHLEDLTQLEKEGDPIPQEIDIEEITEKIKSFQARYKYPESISIKGAMAFMARMFYQYPNVARLWYEQLPKATMD